MNFNVKAPDLRVATPSTPRPNTHIVALCSVSALVISALSSGKFGSALWGADAMSWGGAGRAPLLLAWTGMAVVLFRGLEAVYERSGQHWRILRIALPGTITCLVQFLLPDRAKFVGDALLRDGLLDESSGFAKIFPQALPLDGWLHHGFPRWCTQVASISPLRVAFSIGAFEAFLLGALAGQYAENTSDRASVFAATALTIMFGGYLSLYSGYGKPTTELVLATLAVCVFGQAMLSKISASPLYVSVPAALALLLHRSGLVLLIPALLLVLVGCVSRRDSPLSVRLQQWAACLIPVVAFLFLRTTLFNIFEHFDNQVNINPADVQESGGAVIAGLHGVRLLDSVNVLIFYSPSALVVIAMAFGLPVSNGALAILFIFGVTLPMLLFVRDTLGPFRDYDVLGMCGVALNVFCASRVGMLVGREGTRRAAAVSLVLLSAVPTLQYMWIQTEPDIAIARAMSFVDAAPRRLEIHRAATLDYVGLFELRREHFKAAAEAYHRLSIETPLPRAYKSWGIAAMLADDVEGAREAFTGLRVRTPEDPVATFMLWAASSMTGHVQVADSLAGKMRPWTPEGSEFQQVVGLLDHYPKLEARLAPVLAHRQSERAK